MKRIWLLGLSCVTLAYTAAYIGDTTNEWRQTAAVTGLFAFAAGFGCLVAILARKVP